MSEINLPDGVYTCVVDAIEEGLATVFFEQNGVEKGYTILEMDTLPSSGQHTDAILSITIVSGEIETITYQPEKTTERKSQVQNRFDAISKRQSSEDID